MLGVHKYASFRPIPLTLWLSLEIGSTYQWRWRTGATLLSSRGRQTERERHPTLTPPTFETLE